MLFVLFHKFAFFPLYFQSNLFCFIFFLIGIHCFLFLLFFFFQMFLILCFYIFGRVNFSLLGYFLTKLFFVFYDRLTFFNVMLYIWLNWWLILKLIFINGLFPLPSFLFHHFLDLFTMMSFLIFLLFIRFKVRKSAKMINCKVETATWFRWIISLWSF